MKQILETVRIVRPSVKMALAGLCLVLAGLFLAPSPSPTHAQASASKVLVLHLDGAIGPATAGHISEGIARAAEEGAAAVVLRMDTPGGLDTAMRTIIRDILASPVPVISYVSPSGARAASAGTYILYASHVAAMAPGTNLGAATPVQMGGGGLPFPGGGEDGEKPEDTTPADENPASPGTASELKAVNDAAAYIRSLAEMRGRNADWAEKAVREAESLSASEAAAENVIDLVAPSIEALLQMVDGRSVQTDRGEVTLQTANAALEHVEPDWRTKLLATITDPNVALILMMIGIYGLIFEFMNPGAILPGALGGICLVCGLYALNVLPVNYAGLALILLGMALMVGEAFVPSFGVLGLSGIVAFVLGAIILMDTDAPGFEIAWPVIAGTAGTAVAFTLFLIPFAINAQRRKVVSGREEMTGALGQVRDWSGQKGHIFIHGERWRARSETPLEPEQSVRVLAVDGLTLVVEPADPAPN